MILLRMRRYGSAAWTEISLEGTLEESVGLLLARCIYDVDGNAIQVRRPGENWEELEEFDWLQEEEDD